jgi:hypothetical protein
VHAPIMMHAVVAGRGVVSDFNHELKPPRRLETIEFLKGYGFQCIRYMERYNGFWSSDTSISISEDYHFNIHHPYAETGSGIWVLSCDAAVPAETDFEVCVLSAPVLLP